MNDFRFAIRMLCKSPGYTAVVVLTLAFGIGVNANLFSLVSTFFLEPLPVRNPEELVMVLQRNPTIQFPYGYSYPDFRDFRGRAKSFTDVAAILPNPVHLAVAGQPPERTWVEVASPNCFELAGVHPTLGRLFHPDEGTGTNAAPVLVLSHRYWQRQFGSDPEIIGRTVAINGTPFTVVGVGPADYGGMQWAMSLSAFIPAAFVSSLMPEAGNLTENRGAAAWRLFARLRPGVSLAQARAEIDLLAGQIQREFPDEHRDARPLVIRESHARPDPAFAGLMPLVALLFAGMVTLVLVIACANVANLMLARAVHRQREITLRAALGASRARLIRQLLIESLTLAALAGMVGFLLSHWAGQLLQTFTPAQDIPINTERPWDWRVPLFTIAIALLAGAGAGLVPALRASRVDLVEHLREGTTAAVRGAHHWFRSSLVVAQVTFSLVLLVCAALFLKSLHEARHVALGFRPDNVLLCSLDLGRQQYTAERGRRFLDQLADRVRSLPGVTGVSFTRHVPFDVSIPFRNVETEGGTAQRPQNPLSVPYTVVGTDHFRVAEVPLLRGRSFTTADTDRAPRVAVINDTLARKAWPGEDALGRRLRLGESEPWIEVVGIAGNGKYMMIGEDPRPYVYLPLTQHYEAPVSLFVRTAANPLDLQKPLRDTLAGLDPNLPLYNVRSMDHHLRDSALGLMPLRMGATLAGIQGMIGLLLAVLGLYSVVAHAAGQRTREVGVRMALGARTGDVVRLVVRDGVRLTAVGLGLGLGLALLAGFVISHALYGLKRLDAPVLGTVTLLLFGVAALACYLPARRASRIDPMEALRHD